MNPQPFIDQAREIVKSTLSQNGLPVELHGKLADLPSAVASALQSTDAKARKDVIGKPCRHPSPCKCSDAPLGVSEWREHGKKYGYWEFFEKEITDLRDSEHAEKVKEAFAKGKKEGFCIAQVYILDMITVLLESFSVALGIVFIGTAIYIVKNLL